MFKVRDLLSEPYVFLLELFISLGSDRHSPHILLRYERVRSVLKLFILLFLQLLNLPLKIQVLIFHFCYFVGYFRQLIFHTLEFFELRQNAFRKHIKEFACPYNEISEHLYVLL